MCACWCSSTQLNGHPRVHGMPPDPGTKENMQWYMDSIDLGSYSYIYTIHICSDLWIQSVGVLYGTTQTLAGARAWRGIYLENGGFQREVANATVEGVGVLHRHDDDTGRRRRAPRRRHWRSGGGGALDASRFRGGGSCSLPVILFGCC